MPPVLTLSISYGLTGTLFPEKLSCWLKPPGTVIVDEAQLVTVSMPEGIAGGMGVWDRSGLLPPVLHIFTT